MDLNIINDNVGNFIQHGPQHTVVTIMLVGFYIGSRPSGIDLLRKIMIKTLMWYF